MFRLHCFARVLLVGGLLSVNGCGGAKSTAQAEGEAKSDSVSMPEKSAGGPAKSEAETIAENMAQLSPDDRKLAEEQKYCPVGDSLLGGMGKPYKMIVRGQPVFLCCSHCESVVEKDRDAILAKVEKLKQKK